MTRKALYLLPFLASALLLSGCAAMNTFQTPEVVKPGRVLIGSGVALTGPENRKRSQETPIPFGQLDVYGRVGILPRVEIGARTYGLAGYGIETKVQLLKRPFFVAVSVGHARVETEGSVVLAYDRRLVRSNYAGLIVGRGLIADGHGVLYGGVKLADYYFFETESWGYDVTYTNTEIYDLLVPNVTVGLTSRQDKAIAWPVLEFNTYFLPDINVYTVNIGLQIRLGRR